ncbi:MAG TPA: ATP-binding protein [Bacillota bacterium]|nr:ATP-binding protein [Bacillota bacterium]
MYEVNGLEVKAYLLPGTDSLIQGHPAGVSKIARIGSYVIINSAGVKLVGKISSLQVLEPEKLFWIKTSPQYPEKQVIRTITITLLGQFSYTGDKKWRFERGVTTYPTIDEEVLAPTQEEVDLILNEEELEPTNSAVIGHAYPFSDVTIRINKSKLLSRHCGIFGGTGHGKSCTVTVIIKELLNSSIELPVFIFDVNGEYATAFSDTPDIQILKFGGLLDPEYPRQGKCIRENLRFDYCSFSRNTFRTILKPSDKTQVPAMNFALDVLFFMTTTLSSLELPSNSPITVPAFIQQNPNTPFGYWLLGDISNIECERISNSYYLLRFLSILTEKGVKPKPTNQRIPMKRLAQLIIDRWSIVPSRNNTFQYDAFRYQNVSSLVDRIQELSRDNLFRKVCDTDGGKGLHIKSTVSNVYQSEQGEKKKAPITIFDLSEVPQEYLSIIVDAMLEQHLIEALKRKFEDEPHILVLDEAHHYMGKRSREESENVYLNNPPGDRIAKEGRKHGLHLIVATQRPREMSATIVSQLGTVISHALTNEEDREVVSGFGSYSDKTVLSALPILPRQEAIIMGQAVSIPTRFRVRFLTDSERPKSKDPLEKFFIINNYPSNNRSTSVCI